MMVMMMTWRWCGGDSWTILKWWRKKLNRNIAEMLSWYSHFCVAFCTDSPFTQFTWNTTWAENSKFCSETEEAKFSFFNVFFNLYTDRKTFEFSFRDDWTNMYDFFERQRQSVCIEIHSPLIFIEWVLRPWIHRCKIWHCGHHCCSCCCRRRWICGLRRRCLHHKCLLWR